MYAVFIRFMFGCKHSTKGVIEFRIMAWDAHCAHRDIYVQIGRIIFRQNFYFSSNAIRVRHSDIFLEMNIQRFIRDKYLTQIVGII